MVVAQKLFIADACELIGRFLGKYTADLYYNFYTGKEQQVILSSLEELLTEMLGPTVAQKQLQEFKQKYKL